MTIQAIFFDLGQVLLAFDWKKASRTICERSGLALEEAGTRLRRSRFREYEMGTLSTTEFFEDLKALLEFPDSADELCRICSDIFYPVERNVALARALAAHYPLGIISNTNHAHVDFVQERYEFLEIFKSRIYSCDVQLRKPQPEIYRLALTTLGVRADESLFVDDLHENVVAARKLGWTAIQFLPETDLEAEMRALGVTVPGNPGP